MLLSTLTNQSKAYLFAGIAIFFWSTVASAFKLSLEHLGPIQLVLYSTLFSICILSTLEIELASNQESGSIN